MEMTDELRSQIWEGVEYHLGGKERIEGPPLTDRHREAFADRVPESLMRTWETYGFSGFQNGLMWLCDPLEWQPAADAWTSLLDLSMGPDVYFPFMRSAFGAMDLWGARTGSSVTVYPVANQVMPMDNSDRMETEVRREMHAANAVSFLTEPHFHDEFDSVTEERLFEQCLAARGRLAADEMYSFAPVPVLGGEMQVGSVIVEKAVPHVMLLAQLSSTEVTGDIVATMRARQAQMDEWIAGEE